MKRAEALPPSLRKYFWDTRPESVDPKAHARYIIERILEYGDAEAVRWLLATYARSTIVEVLKDSRVLTPKSAHYWALVFDVPTADILCFSKRSPASSKAIWRR